MTRPSRRIRLTTGIRENRNETSSSTHIHVIRQPTAIVGSVGAGGAARVSVQFMIE
jgi:hypothetical protein